MGVRNAAEVSDGTFPYTHVEKPERNILANPINWVAVCLLEKVKFKQRHEGVDHTDLWGRAFHKEKPRVKVLGRSTHMSSRVSDEPSLVVITLVAYLYCDNMHMTRYLSFDLFVSLKFRARSREVNQGEGRRTI